MLCLLAPWDELHLVWQELQLELEAIRLRLLRRSQIIDALRKAYMKDVITIKNELTRKSSMNEEVWSRRVVGHRRYL